MSDTTTEVTLGEDIPTAELEDMLEEFTEEDVHEFCLMVCEMPSMVMGEHLIRTDEQVKRFSHQLYLYCKKKNIDVQDYLFDEFGLVFSGFVLINGYRTDHKAYKATKQDTIKPSVAEAIVDDGIHQTQYSDVYEPPEVKEHKDTGSGGDNKPVAKEVALEVSEDVVDPTSTDEYTIHGGIPV